MSATLQLANHFPSLADVVPSLLAAGVSIRAGNALWAAVFAALAVGWNPWVKLSAWHQPLPWDKWATAMSLLCGAAAGAFVVRHWGRGGEAA